MPKSGADPGAVDDVRGPRGDVRNQADRRVSGAEGIARRALLICAPSPREVGSAPVATVKIVRAMLDVGWAIDIIAYRWDPEAATDAFFCSMIDGATVYEDVGLGGKPSGWVHRGIRRGRRLLGAHSYDVLISFAHLTWTHVVALSLKRRAAVPWVAFFSDPWSNHTYIKPSRVRGVVERRFEAATYANADALVFTNPKLRDWMFGQFPRNEAWLAKSHHIPYFFDPRNCQAAAESSRSGHGKLILRHLGAIPPGDYAVALFDALRMLIDENGELRDKLRVEFYGSYRSHHAAAIARLSLEPCVRFCQPVGYLESLKLMTECDLLIFLGIPATALDGLGNVTLHLKMSDYLGARRPIFALAPAGSPTGDVLGGDDGFCDSDDPKVIKGSLARFLANPTLPHAQVREQFSRQAVFPRWEEVLNHVVRSS